MKRFVIPVAIIVALALPAYALATKYTGPFTPQVNNDGVEFKVKTHNGAPRKVTQFEWQNVPNSCDSFDFFFTDMKVNDKHKFHGSGHPGQAGNDNYPLRTNVVVTIHGKFKHHNRKAAGTLDIKGTSGCTTDTGPLTWTAKGGAHSGKRFGG
jgi:hypothetical protein